MNSELRDKLRKPLPKQALKQHPTKKFLTVISPIYVIERLNDVFGIGGWSAKYEFICRDTGMIVAKCVLHIRDLELEIEQFGGNDNMDLGDAYKGACTDALTKCCSYLEIGIDVYKGHPEASEYVQEPTHSVKAREQVLKNTNWRDVAIHFGKNNGTKLGDLTPAQLSWYRKEWTPRKNSQGIISQEDGHLRVALDAASDEIHDDNRRDALPITDDDVPAHEFPVPGDDLTY